jgi:hypothetical protein
MANRTNFKSFHSTLPSIFSTRMCKRRDAAFQIQIIRKIISGGISVLLDCPLILATGNIGTGEPEKIVMEVAIYATTSHSWCGATTNDPDLDNNLCVECIQIDPA